MPGLEWHAAAHQAMTWQETEHAHEHAGVIAIRKTYMKCRLQSDEELRGPIHGAFALA